MSGKSTPAPTGSSTTPNDEWRKAVPQSYRSNEVSNIANVLAALEPGATSASKTLLASQFEDMMLNSATSLADYKKKIKKRLAKMQKKYVSSQAAAKKNKSVPVEGKGASGGGGGVGEPSVESQQRDEATKIQRKLKALHGDKLKLVVKYGLPTVLTLRDKYGAEKTKQIQDHIDNTIQWAAEVQAVPPEQAIVIQTGKPYVVPDRSPSEYVAYMKKLTKNLETRIDNIRGYVLKHTQPDVFISERLQEVEDQMIISDQGRELYCAIETMLQQESVDSSSTAGAPSIGGGIPEINQLLEQFKTVIPIPRQAQEEKDACLKYLEKVRTAYQVCLAFLTLKENGRIGNEQTRMQVKGAMKKAHDAAIEAFNFLGERYREDERSQTKSKGSKSSSPAGGHKKIVLEDAWNSVLEYDNSSSEVANSESAVIEVDGDGASTDTSDKRQKKSAAHHGLYPMVMKAQMLMKPGRSLPSNILGAIEKKGGVVCQKESGTMTTVKLLFDDAFEMEIFFFPLLVNIRALHGASGDSNGKSTSTTTVPNTLGEGAKSMFRRDIINGGLATWKSPLYGLRHNPSLEDVDTTSAKSSLLNRKRPFSSLQMQHHQKFSFHVMGVAGNLATVGPLIERRLEYASAQATRVLRRCFASRAKTTNDFEVEVSEATALLNFLEIAKTTYIKPSTQEAAIQ